MVGGGEVGVVGKWVRGMVVGRGGWVRVKGRVVGRGGWVEVVG